MTRRPESLESRRGYLLGAGSAMALLAGCLSSDDTDDSEQPGDDGDDEEPGDDTEPDSGTDGTRAASPSYETWMAADEDWLFMAYANFDMDGTDDEDELELDETVDDPLVRFPFDAAGATVGLFALGLVAADLGELLEPESSLTSEADELFVINGTTVLEGSFETAELDERLTTDSSSFAATYERAGEIRGYDRYEPIEVPDELDEPPIVAIDEAAVIVDSDESRLDRVLAAGAGDRQPVTEEHDTAAWLVEQAGTGDMVFGQVGAVPADVFDLGEIVGREPPFLPADGEDVMTAVSVDPETESVDARFALTAEEIATETRDTIEDDFGTMAVDATADTEGDRITSSGTYDVADIGLDDEEDDSGGDLSEEDAAALVPDDALQYYYPPPAEDDAAFAQFYAEVLEDTDAATIRLESESGAHNEIGPQEGTVDAGTTIPVQVDPEGDEVAVLVTDESGATGELDRRQVPTAALSAETAEEAVPEDALSLSYEPPEAGNFGSLFVEVEASIEAETLVAQPREAPGTFAEAAGSLGSGQPVEIGTTLRVPVDPDGDQVIVSATVDDATGEVARWEGP